MNDLADAHLKGLDYILENGSSSCVLNLGNGEGFSVKEVIQNVKDLTGSQFVVNYGERRVGDPSILVADGKRAREKLKFSPKYDSLKSIIETLDYW